MRSWDKLLRKLEKPKIGGTHKRPVTQPYPHSAHPDTAKPTQPANANKNAKTANKTTSTTTEHGNHAIPKLTGKQKLQAKSMGNIHPTRNRKVAKNLSDLYQCPFCPCQFTTIQDQHKHIQTFSAIKERHQTKWHDEQKRRLRNQ